MRNIAAVNVSRLHALGRPSLYLWKEGPSQVSLGWGRFFQKTGLQCRAMLHILSKDTGEKPAKKATKK